jgi:hypothetical protein
MKKWLLVIIAVLSLVLLCSGCSCSCAGDSDPTNPENIAKAGIVKPVNYGNGVYYFDAVKAQFGNSLSAFIERHPELEFVGMAPNDCSGHGYTTGYFVVFSEK